MCVLEREGESTLKRTRLRRHRQNQIFSATGREAEGLLLFKTLHPCVPGWAHLFWHNQTLCLCMYVYVSSVASVRKCVSGCWREDALNSAALVGNVDQHPPLYCWNINDNCCNHFGRVLRNAIKEKREKKRYCEVRSRACTAATVRSFDINLSSLNEIANCYSDNISAIMLLIRTDTC